MFDSGSIVATLKLDSMQFDQSLKRAQNSVTRAGESVKQFGQNLMGVSRQLQAVATSMTFLGAGITTPLVMAFRSAEKHSAMVRTEVQRMNSAFRDFQVSIAESLVPTMKEINNVIANLVKNWQNLSPELRETILRVTLLTGLFSLIGGVLSTVVVKITTLFGFIIKNVGTAVIGVGSLNAGFIALAASVGVLIFLIKNYDSIGKGTFNNIEIGINMTLIGLAKLVKGFLWLQRVQNFGFKPSYFDNMMTVLDSFVTGAEERMADLMGPNGTGVITGFIDDLKSGIEEVKGLFTSMGSDDYSAFTEGWKTALQSTLMDLTDWGKQASDVVNQVSTGMQNIFSNFFQNIMKGEINSAKEIFVEFGNFVIKILVERIYRNINMIAKIITTKTLMGIAGAFGGGFTGTSNSTTAGVGARMGYADGIDSVPYNGLYKLHAGEKVVPRYDATKSQSQPITIYNAITPEAVASAMMSREGEGVIVNVINSNSLRNGVVRREVVKR
jgi:hypothetical protein